MSKNKKITVFCDPGHAWGKVARSELIEMGLIDKITSYSYQCGEWVYLEEDCDLARYVDALEKAGFTPRFKSSYSKNSSKIRTYERFTFKINEVKK